MSHQSLRGRGTSGATFCCGAIQDSSSSFRSDLFPRGERAGSGTQRRNKSNTPASKSVVISTTPAVLYDRLKAQLRSLPEGERDFIANAANFSALLFHSLPDVN